MIELGCGTAAETAGMLIPRFFTHPDVAVCPPLQTLPSAGNHPCNHHRFKQTCCKGTHRDLLYKKASSQPFQQDEGTHLATPNRTDTHLSSPAEHATLPQKRTHSPQGTNLQLASCTAGVQGENCAQHTPTAYQASAPAAAVCHTGGCPNCCCCCCHSWERL